MQCRSCQVIPAQPQAAIAQQPAQPFAFQFCDRCCCRYAACVAAMLPDVRHNQCAEQFLQLQHCVRLSLRKR
jgi:hypothetical protein